MMNGVPVVHGAPVFIDGYLLASVEKSLEIGLVLCFMGVDGYDI